MELLKLSHSSLSTFNSCARKLEFRKFYPQGVREDAYAAMVGKALHEAFQCYLVTADEEAAIFKLIMQFKLSVQSKDKYEPRNLEAAYATLMEMISQHHELSEYKLAKIMVNGEERPAIEVPFRLNIKLGGLPFMVGNRAVVYEGLIDQIMHHIMSDSFGVLDVKTHRRNLWDMTPVYRFDNQCTPYGIILDTVLGRQIDQLTVKYFSCYVDAEKPKAVMYTYERTHEDIVDWAQTLYDNLIKIKTYHEANWWPRNPNSCTAFNSTCGHFEVCQSRNVDFLTDYFNMNAVEPRDELVPWFEADLELAA